MVTRHTKESVAKKLLIILGNLRVCIDATFLDVLKYLFLGQVVLPLVHDSSGPSFSKEEQN